MRESNKTAVYQKVLIDLERRIRHDRFEEHMPLPSLKQLCLNYGISYMTACRVYGELEKLGIVYGVKGKGFFIAENRRKSNVPREKELSFLPLKGIVVFHDVNSAVSPNGSMPEQNRHIEGILERAAGFHIPCRDVYLQDSNNIQVDDNEGTILVYSSTSVWIMQMLKLRRIRTVLINNYHSEAFCVVNDNYHGMSCLMDFLQEQGCSRILLCSRHFCDLGLANLSERTHAFVTECEHRRLPYRLLPSGDYGELLKIYDSKTECPDAIVFLTDESASLFMRKLGVNKMKTRPVIAAFGCDGPHRFPIATYSVDPLDMGRAAVDLIRNNAPEDWMLPEVVRIRGKFAVV